MRYLPIIIFLLMLQACGPRVICDPAPPITLGSFGFIVRDSNGRNLFGSSAANRLDIANIKVTQPCSNIAGKAHLEQDSILFFDVQLCHMALVQWRETDLDTITYSVLTGPDGCGGRRIDVDGSSIRINGVKPDLDTSARGDHMFIIRK